jgi:cytochrome c biogenesis protein CcdA
MSRQGEWRALAMLLAYNLMFVAPLVLVLAGVLAGWRILDVAAWTRREAVVAKVALGILFLLLAAGTWLFF